MCEGDPEASGEWSLGNRVEQSGRRSRESRQAGSKGEGEGRGWAAPPAAACTGRRAPSPGGTASRLLRGRGGEARRGSSVRGAAAAAAADEHAASGGTRLQHPCSSAPVHPRPCRRAGGSASGAHLSALALLAQHHLVRVAARGWGVSGGGGWERVEWGWWRRSAAARAPRAPRLQAGPAALSRAQPCSPARPCQSLQAPPPSAPTAALTARPCPCTAPARACCGCWPRTGPPAPCRTR